MELQEKILELVKRIRQAFPVDPVPFGEALISHECEECFKLRDDFFGLRWPEVSRELLEIHYDDLSLFTPESYHYYLPSFLSYSLQRIPPTDEEWIEEIPPSLQMTTYQPVLDFTAYSLCPSDHPHWTKRYEGRFTDVQAEVIREWLSLVLEHPDPFDVDEVVAKTALEWWSQSMEKA